MGGGTVSARIRGLGASGRGGGRIHAHSEQRHDPQPIFLGSMSWVARHSGFGTSGAAKPCRALPGASRGSRGFRRVPGGKSCNQKMNPCTQLRYKQAWAIWLRGQSLHKILILYHCFGVQLFNIRFDHDSTDDPTTRGGSFCVPLVPVVSGNQLWPGPLYVMNIPCPEFRACRALGSSMATAGKGFRQIRGRQPLRWCLSTPFGWFNRNRTGNHAMISCLFPVCFCCC